MEHRRLRQDATAVPSGDGAGALLPGPCLLPDTLELSFGAADEMVIAMLGREYETVSICSALAP